MFVRQTRTGSSCCVALRDYPLLKKTRCRETCLLWPNLTHPERLRKTHEAAIWERTSHRLSGIMLEILTLFRVSHYLWLLPVNTGLFKMIVGVLTCHTQYTSFSRCNPMWFLSMGLCQGSGLCSSSSCKYPGTEGSYVLQTVWNELDYRVDVCRITKGAHIEHL